MFNNINQFNKETKKEKKIKEKKINKEEREKEKEKDLKETTAISFSINPQKNESYILDIKLKSIITKDNVNIDLFKRVRGDLDILKEIVGKLPPL